MTATTYSLGINATKWMVQNKMHTHNTPNIITALRSGITIEAVSDGSYHPDLQHGTSAWVLCDPDMPQGQ